MQVCSEFGHEIYTSPRLTWKVVRPACHTCMCSSTPVVDLHHVFGESHDDWVARCCLNTEPYRSLDVIGLVCWRTVSEKLHQSYTEILSHFADRLSWFVNQFLWSTKFCFVLVIQPKNKHEMRDRAKTPVLDHGSTHFDEATTRYWSSIYRACAA